MEGRAGRHLSDRELRDLSTEELLSLIRSDITELDRVIVGRRHGDRTKKAVRRRTIQEAMASLTPDAEAEAASETETEPVAGPFHAVTCCDHHMGDFPPVARVRCPFCGEWHRAGDFPYGAD